MARLFGTDGVRGVAGRELTPMLVYGLGKAGAEVLAAEGAKCILIGRDTRESGDMLFSALAAGVMAAGLDAVDLGVIPTPAVAYLTGKDPSAGAGVVISASHNPYQDNGIKFFNTEGTKLPDAVEDRIEDKLRTADTACAENPGRLLDGHGRVQAYVDHLTSAVGGSFAGRRFLLDCANGAMSTVAGGAFRALGAEVLLMSAAPDGQNINQNCGSTHPEALAAAVAAGHFDAGFAYDGDGDRLILCDEQGEVQDGDEIMALLAMNLYKKGKLAENTLVMTVMSNLGLELYLREQGISSVRTSVGDRYIMESMRESGFNLGGEQSGHIIVRDIMPTGDGLLTSLLLASILQNEGQPMSALCGRMNKLPQVQINVPVGHKDRLETCPGVQNALQAVKETLGSRERILVRPSGTEPKVRVMAEGEDEERIRSIAEALAKTVQTELA